MRRALVVLLGLGMATEGAADATLGMAWREIERLRAEVNEYAAIQWNERNAGTVSEWQPPYPGFGEFGQP